MAARLAAWLGVGLLVVASGCAQIIGIEAPAGDGIDGPATGDGGFEPPRDDGGFPVPPSDAGGTGACAPLPNFRAETNYSVGPDPTSIAFGDLNKDGIQDVVVASRSTGMVTILRGSPNGTLGQQQVVPFTTAPQCPAGTTSVAVADFDGDGFQDLAVVSGEGCGRLAVRRQSSAMPGQFLAEQLVTTANRRAVAVAGDLDGDGRGDLVLRSETSVQVFHGRSDMPGLFTAGLSEPASQPPSPEIDIEIADMNGDLVLDVAWLDSSGVRYRRQLNGFPRMYQPTIGVAGSGVFGFAIGRINDDALEDLVVASNSGQVYFQDPAEHIFLAGPIIQQLPGFRLAVADVNGDGRADLSSEKGVMLQCSPPAAPGTFGVGPDNEFRVLEMVDGVHFHDLTGDGRVDAFGLEMPAGLLKVRMQM